MDNAVRENSSDDEIEICYQDYTDFEAFKESLQQPNAVCAACLKTEQWNVNNTWIGCNHAAHVKHGFIDVVYPQKLRERQRRRLGN